MSNLHALRSRASRMALPKGAVLGLVVVVVGVGGALVGSGLVVGGDLGYGLILVGGLVVGGGLSYVLNYGLTYSLGYGVGYLTARYEIGRAQQVFGQLMGRPPSALGRAFAVVETISRAVLTTRSLITRLITAAVQPAQSTQGREVPEGLTTDTDLRLAMALQRYRQRLSRLVLILPKTIRDDTRDTAIDRLMGVDTEEEAAAIAWSLMKDIVDMGVRARFHLPPEPSAPRLILGVLFGAGAGLLVAVSAVVDLRTLLEGQWTVQQFALIAVLLVCGAILGGWVAVRRAA